MDEARAIADLFMEYREWGKVRDAVLTGNVLSKRKASTAKRKYTEIQKRLAQLNYQQIEHLAKGDADQARLMVLLSLAKTYDFISDFVKEILRTKLMVYDRVLSDTDYLRFVDSKRATHPELDQMSEKTAAKVKQLVHKMLVQVGLIDSLKTRIIVKPHVDPISIELVVHDNPIWLRAFLFTDAEIKALSEKAKV